MEISPFLSEQIYGQITVSSFNALPYPEKSAIFRDAKTFRLAVDPDFRLGAFVPAPVDKEIDSPSHWNRRYLENSDETLAWTEGAYSLSLKWITQTISSHTASIVDVGAGRSLLLPTLLINGYENLTHVEWSETTSQHLRSKLGRQASDIKWFIGDLCDWQPDEAIDLWHDRAVFHFQTDFKSINNYLRSLHRNVRSGGYVLLSTFHLNGPETCSDLLITRYGVSSLLSTLRSFDGSNWDEINSKVYWHYSPTGVQQKFQYVLVQRQKVS
ncbi:MAG: class I SAM-dependent methyltransferase [Pseudomonadota bacterium]|nr:class I SAM-dependent methyltransferase [Pseudomonadota bacterium]